jgi:hypothetical protein
MANEARQLGRAKNAILSFLGNRLAVPRIYIDAYWADQRIDVMAIDRDGVGDVHAVLLLLSTLPTSQDAVPEYLAQGLSPLVNRLSSIPAQYKYIGAVQIDNDSRSPLPGIPPRVLDAAFASDGLGRIGFLSVMFPEHQEPRTDVVIKPERFRAKVAQMADEYVKQHQADWEIRA